VTFKRTPIETVLADVEQVETSSKQAVNKQKQAEMSKQKRTILSFIKENDGISTSEIAAHVKLSESRIRAILKEMAGEELIKKIGSYRGAYYLVK
jgi:predicted HTH transcriptional regulator